MCSARKVRLLLFTSCCQSLMPRMHVALDQILSQLMENSSSHPVPASEEIMENLPKTVLEAGSPLLEKDCAVCKEQFQLNTEDPAEQVVVTLPCKHPFHEGCIMPWLKSSATCPVCRSVSSVNPRHPPVPLRAHAPHIRQSRHELVPQPHHHGPGEGPSRRPNPPGNNRSSSPGSGATGGGGLPGLFGLFGNLMSGASAGAGGSNRTNNSNSQSDQGRHSSARRNSDGEMYGSRGGRRMSDGSDGIIESYCIRV